MALQGTIDTFPLGDVLTLLASSAKSGRLVLNGDRGSGSLWVDGGNLLGGEINGTAQPDSSRLIFELFRFTEGAFEFHTHDSSDLPTADVEPSTLEVGITNATAMMEQWCQIEAVVPSTSHGVDLVQELPGDELVVDQELWSILVSVSRSASVAEIASALAMDSYEASAVVAGLVGQGLVEVVEPVEPVEPVIDAADVADGNHSDGLDSDNTAEVSTAGDDGIDSVGEMWAEHSGNFPEHFPIDDLVGDGAEDDDLWSSPAMAQLEAQRRADAATAGELSQGDRPEGAEVAFDLSDLPESFDSSDPRTWDDADLHPGQSGAEAHSAEDTADEVLRQMSRLSPKAAEAIAAALGSGAQDAGDRASKTESANDTPLGPVSFLDSF